MNDSATNHCTDYRDVILICLMTSAFISITLDDVTSFSGVKNVRNMCKCLSYSQNSWGIFCVMAEDSFCFQDVVL